MRKASRPRKMVSFIIFSLSLNKHQVGWPATKNEFLAAMKGKKKKKKMPKFLLNNQDEIPRSSQTITVLNHCFRPSESLPQSQLEDVAKNSLCNTLKFLLMLTLWYCWQETQKATNKSKFGAYYMPMYVCMCICICICIYIYINV